MQQRLLPSRRWPSDLCGTIFTVVGSGSSQWESWTSSSSAHNSKGKHRFVQRLVVRTSPLRRSGVDHTVLVTAAIANGRYCHVMYKLLYPSIRVRTAPPVSVRIRTRELVLVLVCASRHTVLHVRIFLLFAIAALCDSGPESQCFHKYHKRWTQSLIDQLCSLSHIDLWRTDCDRCHGLCTEGTSQQAPADESRRAFSVSGPLVWNNLPDYLRDYTLSHDSFRRYLKTYLFARY